ncbi:MAG TPA: hypothetical protein ACHBZ9_07740 [Arsenophonus nasoniae]|uniref:hypothetical protein n=1 Tax=Arsenophonus nasoniae TaxID=638 RepID=UPI00387A3737
MRFLIGYSEYKSMITYEDIKKAAIESERKKEDCLYRFIEIIENFIEAYERSLAISGNPTFINASVNYERIVTLGVIEHNNFREISANFLSFPEDFKIPFYIKTIVNCASLHAPWVAIKCFIFRKDGKNFIRIVFIEEKSAKVCRIPDSHTLDVYNDVCEALKAIVLNTIKSSTPL